MVDEVGGFERVVEAALARFGQHRGGEVDPLQPLDPRPQRRAGKAGAATEIERAGEPAARRRGVDAAAINAGPR